MFYHRVQTQNFRTSEAPLRTSFYSFLLRPRFQYLNVGDLIEYAMDHLWQLTGVRTNRVDFTLVNVCSPFTKYSHGSCSEPPEAAWPRGPSLVLTFATTIMQDYDLDPEYRTKITKDNVRWHDNQTTQWSPTRGRVDFVSIAVPLQISHDLGLQQPKSNELEYIYNLVGAATKSIMRNQTKYLPHGQPYDDVHERLNLKDKHDRIYGLPLGQLFTQIPYHLWVFSGELWRRAPNAIPQRLITPAVALYFFMYLRPDIGLNTRASRDVGLKRLGLLKSEPNSGIFGHLTGSVLRFGQMVKSQDTVELDTEDLLAPGVLAALLRNSDGSTQLPTGADYRMELRSDTRTLVQALASMKGEISDILFPPKEVALSLLTGDHDYIEAVRTLLDQQQSTVA